MEKDFLFRIVLLVVVIANLSLTSFSQRYLSDPDYGADSAKRKECAQNLSTMSEFVKIDIYDYAFDAWRWCFFNCPKSSKNIYIMGAKILKHNIENAENDEIRNHWIDTLMFLYDKRIEHYDQKGYVLGKKGVDLLRYQNNQIEEAYGYLKESVQLRKGKSEDAVAVTLMQSANVLFKNGQISEDEMISNYVLTIESLEQKSKLRGNNSTKRALETVERIFAVCGAADCESLVDIFGPKYTENPNDVELLKKIADLLDNAGCKDYELYEKTSESLHKIEPSSKSAYHLARLFVMKNNYQKAADYYEEAIKYESDPKQQAQYYNQLGVITHAHLDNDPKARQYALKAIDLDPNYGPPYILIGNAYASSSKECGSSNFEIAAVFWAAVDKYEKAKQVDPSVENEANKLINQYSKYFPTKEEAFFNGYTDGDTYKVGSWINETTTVRTKK